MLGNAVRVPAAGRRTDDVAKWAERLNRGIARRKKEESEWRKNREFAFPTTKKREHTTGDRTEVNKVKSWIEGRMAALAFRNPSIKIRPTNADGWDPIPVPVIDKQTGEPVMNDVPAMLPGGVPVIGVDGMPVINQVPAQRLVPRWRVLEQVVNTIISRPSFGTAATIRRMIQSAHLAIGVVKVGYCADFKSYDDEPASISAEELLYLDADKLRDDYYFSESGVPQFDDHGFLVPRSRVPIAERWFFDWVSPDQVIFDPDGKNDFQTHNWVAYEYLRPLADVMADDLLSNKKGLKATGYRKEDHDIDGVQVWGTIELSEDEFSALDETEQMVRLFEIIDKKNGRLIVLADGHDKKLRDAPLPVGMSREGPYSFYRYHERENDWFPEPPASGQRIINDWYDKNNEQAMHEMRKAQDKVLADKRVFDDVAMERLLSPVKEVIPVDLAKVGDAGLRLEDVARPLPLPTRTAEYLGLGQRISMDFDESAAQASETRGVASAKTATQASVLDSRSVMREDYQRGILGEALRDAFTKLVASIKANMTLPMYIEIAGDDGMVMAMNVGPDSDVLNIECDVDVTIEDMVPPNKARDQMAVDRLIGHMVSMPLLAVDEDLTAALFEIYDIRDPRIAKGLPKMAHAWAAINAPQPAAPKPEAGPPSGESDAIAKRGEMF